MTATPAVGPRSTGRKVLAVILAIIAIAFIAVGIVYCVVPSGSLPGWLGHETVQVGKQVLPSPTYRPLRAVGALIAGVVFGINAVFSLMYKRTTGTTTTTGSTGTGTGVTEAS